MTMPDTQGAGTPGQGVETDPQATGGPRGQMRQVKELQAALPRLEAETKAAVGKVAPLARDLVTTMFQ